MKVCVGSYFALFYLILWNIQSEKEQVTNNMMMKQVTQLKANFRNYR